VLVTGADGFVGRHLLRALAAAGHTPLAACHPDSPPLDVPTVPLELGDAGSVRAALDQPLDAIVHLAAVASSREASRDPGHTWCVNAGGTARLLAAVAERHGPAPSGPLVLVASSAEVYGDGEARPRVETDPPRPLTPYAASKLGAEVAAAQAIAGWGLRVMVVRPFPLTGPGQRNRLLPIWLAGLRAGKREIDTGHPETVRDFMDVRDAAAGMIALLARGRAGETYNLATGRGVRFVDLFARLAGRLGVEARLVVPGPAGRRADPPHLVGDPGKLTLHTGWTPQIALDRTLADLIDAQAD
jgi:GDP-4-dehydro-6-deoxy-D-mannose reductase